MAAIQPTMHSLVWRYLEPVIAFLEGGRRAVLFYTPWSRPRAVGSAVREKGGECF